jgi:hypothetical protein
VRMARPDAREPMSIFRLLVASYSTTLPAPNGTEGLHDYAAGKQSGFT